VVRNATINRIYEGTNRFQRADCRGAAALILSAQVAASQIERVDRMERGDEPYPTAVEGSAW
jgi:UDP-N-acetylglucosamine enolpyruvyl transferase